MGLYDVGSVRVRGDMDLSDSFAWNEYLEKTGGTPAPWECFKQSRTPPENLFQVDSLLEAVDQRIALNETPPPQSPASTAASSTSVTNTASGSAVPSFSTTSLSESASGIAAAPLPALSSSASLAPRRRRFSLTGGGQQLRRFRSAPFSLARVIETAGPRLRVRLVGTDDRNDCWFLVDSDQIRPYPSHEILQPPFGYVHNHLVWNKTLRRTVEEGKAAPAECFARPPPDPEKNLFRKGDKLEAVDRHNAQLICPATIGEVSGLHVLVSFDGWSGNFDYWTRYDSRDLFPCGWCKLAGHALQSPGPAAIQHLNLTPTKMPVPRPLESTSSVSQFLEPVQSRATPPTVSARRSAPSRRRRLTVVSNSSRRPRLSTVQPTVRHAFDNVLTIKSDKVVVPAVPLTSAITTATTTTTSTAQTTVASPQPPLPRLTVITKTLEDGSPQTIIKATSSTTSTSSSEKPNSHTLVEGGSPLNSATHPLPSDAEIGIVERKRRSKKHKRHSSKEGRHRHLSSDLHRSVSDFCKPTKLVIRQRSGDLLGSSTAQLFVDTMAASPPPISSHFSNKFSPLIGSPSQRSPSACTGGTGDPAFFGRTQMPSQSTVSPASMDLGPCSLPNVTEWSTDDVYNYLISKDSTLVEIATTFRQQEIDGSALLLLDIEIMRSLLNMKLGPALKIDDIVDRLKRGHL